MPKFDPSFAIKPLQHVSPGAVVIYRDALAFAGVNRSAPQGQQLVTLAVHDAQQGQFVYRYFDGVQPNVVVLTGEAGQQSMVHPKNRVCLLQVGLARFR